jgi:hypothetical protein
MAPSGAVTSVVTHAQRRIRRKIATRAGTLLIDRATNLAPDLSFQRHTTRRRLVGAAQTNQRGRERNSQIHRNAFISGRRQIGTVKINAKGGTTGAATETGKIRHLQGWRGLGETSLLSLSYRLAANKSLPGALLQAQNRLYDTHATGGSSEKQHFEKHDRGARRLSIPCFANIP